MDKDFDYDEFMNFMKSQIHADCQHTKQPQDTRVLAIEQQHDDLEVDVAAQPCYTNVVDMLNAIKET